MKSFLEKKQNRSIFKSFFEEPFIKKLIKFNVNNIKKEEIKWKEKNITIGDSDKRIAKISSRNKKQVAEEAQTKQSIELSDKEEKTKKTSQLGFNNKSSRIKESQNPSLIASHLKDKGYRFEKIRYLSDILVINENINYLIKNNITHEKFVSPEYLEKLVKKHELYKRLKALTIYVNDNNVNLNEILECDKDGINKFIINRILAICFREKDLIKHKILYSFKENYIIKWGKKEELYILKYDKLKDLDIMYLNKALVSMNEILYQLEELYNVFNFSDYFDEDFLKKELVRKNTFDDYIKRLKRITAKDYFRIIEFVRTIQKERIYRSRIYGDIYELNSNTDNKRLILLLKLNLMNLSSSSSKKLIKYFLSKRMNDYEIFLTVDKTLDEYVKSFLSKDITMVRDDDNLHIIGFKNNNLTPVVEKITDETIKRENISPSDVFYEEIQLNIGDLEELGKISNSEFRQLNTMKSKVESTQLSEFNKVVQNFREFKEIIFYYRRSYNHSLIMNNLNIEIIDRNSIDFRYLSFVRNVNDNVIFPKVMSVLINNSHLLHFEDLKYIYTYRIKDAIYDFQMDLHNYNRNDITKILKLVFENKGSHEVIKFYLIHGYRKGTVLKETIKEFSKEHNLNFIETHNKGRSLLIL